VFLYSFIVSFIIRVTVIALVRGSVIFIAVCTVVVGSGSVYRSRWVVLIPFGLYRIARRAMEVCRSVT
jgi:hypothetical protein